MNPWPILAGLFAGTGASIIVMAFVLPYRLGDMKRRFEDYVQRTNEHAGEFKEVWKEIRGLRERMAILTGKTNGGLL